MKSPAADIVTRDYTIHMSKRLYGVTFKNRAPRAVREIKKFAQSVMKTKYDSPIRFHFFTHDPRKSLSIWVPL